jgi:DNA-binding transcriptional LysR family regulator
MALPHIKRGSLVSLLDNWRRPSQPLQLVYPANRHLSAKLRVFADWAVEAFAARLGAKKFSGEKSLKR